MYLVRIHLARRLVKDTLVSEYCTIKSVARCVNVHEVGSRGSPQTHRVVVRSKRVTLGFAASLASVLDIACILNGLIICFIRYRYKQRNISLIYFHQLAQDTEEFKKRRVYTLDLGYSIKFCDVFIPVASCQTDVIF